MRSGRKFPTRLGFCLRLAAYGGFLVLLWFALEAASGGLREAWDRLVSRPAAAAKPFLPEGECRFGLYQAEAPWRFDGVLQVEEALGRRFAVLSLYQAWGSRREHRFPRDLLARIDQAGYLPMLTWEPWTTEFDEESYGPRESRQYRCLRDIAQGRYDPFLHEWARGCLRWGRPLLLRPAHEMNNPGYPWSFATGNTAADFKAAWRRLKGIFDDQGCRNVAWVWTPLPAADLGDYYPGEDAVDWVGVPVLNYGRRWPPYRWLELEELYAETYSRLETFRKPILIPELATTGDSAEKGDWLVRGLTALPDRFPRVRLVVFFDALNDRSHYPEGIPWTFTAYPSILGRLARILEHPWFRPGPPGPREEANG